MTICIAAICRWNYGNTQDDAGFSVVAAADRTLTDASGIQYEPIGQGKWSSLPGNIIILIADSLDVHSELISQITAYAEEKKIYTIKEIADKYAEYLRQLKARRSVQHALGGNYGFSAAQFAELQRSMDPNVVVDLHNQIMDHERSITAQAIVAGCDEKRKAHLYHINSSGIVRPHGDIGFVCIGAGGRQATAQLVQRGYSNRWDFYSAMAAVYAAKKSAEVVAGIGKRTDLFHITETASVIFTPDREAALNKLYTRYEKRRTRLEASAVTDFTKWDASAIQRGGTLGTVFSGPFPPAPPPPSPPPQPASSRAPRGGKTAGTRPRKQKPQSPPPLP